MKIIGDRLLVKQLPQEDRIGSIHLAQAHRPEQFMHEVVAVGSGVTDDIKPGDRIFLDQYRLTDRTSAGENLWIVSIEACCLLLPSTPEPGGAIL